MLASGSGPDSDSMSYSSRLGIALRGLDYIAVWQQKLAKANKLVVCDFVNKNTNFQPALMCVRGVKNKQKAANVLLRRVC